MVKLYKLYILGTFQESFIYVSIAQGFTAYGLKPVCLNQDKNRVVAFLYNKMVAVMEFTSHLIQLIFKLQKKYAAYILLTYHILK